MASRKSSLTIPRDLHKSASSVSLGFSGSTSYKQVKGLSLDTVVESLFRLLPEHEDFVREHIVEPFCLGDDEYEKVQTLFEENMMRGLNKETHDRAPVKMYNSFVRAIPDGTEKGKYIAIDFEGTNFRMILVTLEDDKETIETRNGLLPSKIQDSNGKEDLSFQLFDCLASSLHRFLSQMNLLNTAETIPLGLTFAFHCKQTALNKAVLDGWSKNFHVDGVEGCEIVGLLNDAIKRKGEMNVDCVMIVNDTVGTLMSGALHDPDCSIGLVLSKGTNACYLENLDKVQTWEGQRDEPREMIVVTEWQGFGKDGCLDFIRTEYDKQLDSNSRHPGRACYEKMIGGGYLGEIVRLVLQNMRDNDILFTEHWSDDLSTPRRLYTKYISEIMSEEDVRFKATRHVYDELHLYEASELECRVLHHICQLVSVRAVTLTAIGVACLINRLDKKEVGIAADGALYRFHPLFHDLLTEMIPKYLKKDTKFRFVQSKDGKGYGAAIAAAVAERLNHR